MKRKIMAIVLVISILAGFPVSAYGEVSVPESITIGDQTVTQPAYIEWLPQWQEHADNATGRILLTPGADESCLNFSWYSQKAAAPAVMISTEQSFEKNKIFKGHSLSIKRYNGTNTYHSACHVSVKKYLKPDTTYFYRYTDDCSTAERTWSGTFTYHNPGTASFSVILTGDPQIGAFDNISADAYNWDETLSQAVRTVPEAAFLLSTGDQIDYKTDLDPEGLRERQYAAFLYPETLRSLPVAAAIGNHDTKGTDYKYHFNNPNSSGGYGSTPAGCDYYFSRGSALFIVLNSNSRKLSSHRRLMKKAIASHPGASWRIVLMHHDIYGSGKRHSKRSSANVRTIFAPLMDEFQIDIVLTGHDHSYARSYSMLDGTAIRYRGNTLTDPAGTTYFSLGTPSGSKIYGLTSPKQYYVAERSNTPVPTFSILSVRKKRLILKTYDLYGKKYANDFTLVKTKKKQDPLTLVKKAKKLLKKKSLSGTRRRKLSSALKRFQRKFRPTKKDAGAEKIARYYRTSKDPLSYYGYAAGTSDILPKGFSTLLDKTRKNGVSISPSAFRSALNSLKTRIKITRGA